MYTGSYMYTRILKYKRGFNFYYKYLINGISIMLLNTFKTCLYNLFNSKLDDSEIKDLIGRYVSNYKIIECLLNVGAIKYFSTEYLIALKIQNIYMR